MPDTKATRLIIMKGSILENLLDNRKTYTVTQICCKIMCYVNLCVKRTVEHNTVNPSMIIIDTLDYIYI